MTTPHHAERSEWGWTLPPRARASLNRCNLPAVILGSAAFQQWPVPLELDGVLRSHRDLFDRLARLDDAAARSEQFADYVDVHFLLRRPEDVGLTKTARRDRSRADYRKLIRGWMFDADGTEGAVLKGWVESRFGLLPRHHAGPIRERSDATYLAYQEAWATGLYNTNALEAQLDVVYAFCQYELPRRFAGRTHLRLYRGVNRIDEHEVLAEQGPLRTLILNNLSSFTMDRDRADEFGDYILSTEVPLPKISFFSNMLPGLLQGEHEFAVIGGVYEVRLTTL
ncbi:MAG: NAD(+)--dinitrogen-reductase ADP-D-ribosyltransferase [Polyangiaceae bacterium]|jgi:NAD+--dinitrogen-reductase ADP-D-ribosyltransferase